MTDYRNETWQQHFRQNLKKNNSDYGPIVYKLDKVASETGIQVRGYVMGNEVVIELVSPSDESFPFLLLRHDVQTKRMFWAVSISSADEEAFNNQE